MVLRPELSSQLESHYGYGHRCCDRRTGLHCNRYGPIEITEMKMNDTFWHDGNVELINYCEAKSSLTIVCNLYENPEARARTTWQITVKDLHSVVLAIPNFHQQQRNRNAGAISDGATIQTGKRSTFRLNLAAGYLEVSGGAIVAARVRRLQKKNGRPKRTA